LCGRYRLCRTDRLAAALDAQPRFEEFTEKGIVPRFEFRPSQRVPIIRYENGRRVLEGATWGFVPSWSTPDSKAPKPINAKAETVMTSGMFREAFRSSRCLLPTDGFFEPKGPKTLKRREQYFFHRVDDSLFAMAGLCSKSTCVLITTIPNREVGAIHDRMPVILHAENYDRWLDPLTPATELQAMLRPAPDDFLACQPEPPPPEKEPGLFSGLW
jgi:putative SOS response-associated peptidase YedK